MGQRVLVLLSYSTACGCGLEWRSQHNLRPYALHRPAKSREMHPVLANRNACAFELLPRLLEFFSSTTGRSAFLAAVAANAAVKVECRRSHAFMVFLSLSDLQKYAKCIEHVIDPARTVLHAGLAARRAMLLLDA